LLMVQNLPGTLLILTRRALVQGSHPGPNRKTRVVFVRVSNFGERQVGTTVDVSCGNLLCYAARHVVLRRCKSFGGNWQPLAKKARGTASRRVIRPARLPNDAASRSWLRDGVSTYAAGRMSKFSTQSLPTAGIRVTGTGTWCEADTKGGKSSGSLHTRRLSGGT